MLIRGEYSPRQTPINGYKNVSQKKCFLYINEDFNECHQQKKTCTFLYIQKAKKCETFLYPKTQTLFKKQDNFRYVFMNKKHDTLR